MIFHSYVSLAEAISFKGVTHGTVDMIFNLTNKMHIDTHIHLHEYTCITSRLPNIPQYKSRYIILHNRELEAGWDMRFYFTRYYINYTKQYSILYHMQRKKHVHIIIL